jgi:hypothetical protein
MRDDTIVLLLNTFFSPAGLHLFQTLSCQQRKESFTLRDFRWSTVPCYSDLMDLGNLMKAAKSMMGLIVLVEGRSSD